MTNTTPRPLEYEGMDKKPATGFKRKPNYTLLFIGAVIITLTYLVTKNPEPLVPKGPVCTAAPMMVQPYP